MDNISNFSPLGEQQRPQSQFIPLGLPPSSSNITSVAQSRMLNNPEFTQSNSNPFPQPQHSQSQFIPSDASLVQPMIVDPSEPTQSKKRRSRSEEPGKAPRGRGKTPRGRGKAPRGGENAPRGRGKATRGQARTPLATHPHQTPTTTTMTTTTTTTTIAGRALGIPVQNNQTTTTTTTARRALAQPLNINAETIIIRSDDPRYKGESKDGLADGENGILYFSEECSEEKMLYRGDWKAGKYHGYGVLYFSDTAMVKYMGDWENGMRHGYDGIEYFFDGMMRYNGQWKNGMPHGQGTEYSSYGEKIYSGPWENGNKTGTTAAKDHPTIQQNTPNEREPKSSLKKTSEEDRNIPLIRSPIPLIRSTTPFNKEASEGGQSRSLIFTLYTKYEGKWKDGFPEDDEGIYYRLDKVAYRGGIRRGKREGEGMEIAPFSDTKSYEGGWRDDKRDGRGASYHPDGKICYEGQWKAGKPDGDGIEYYMGGFLRYKGTWKEGKEEGRGVEFTYFFSCFRDPFYLPVYLTKNCNYYKIFKYEGDFKNGLRHGEGTLYSKDVKIQNYESTSIVDEGTSDFTGGKICYQGQWLDGEPQGNVKEFYSDGQIRYDGEYKNEKKDGFGVEITYLFKDTYVDPADLNEHCDYTIVTYEGYFKDGLRHGKGTETRKDVLQSQNNESFSIADDIVIKGTWEKGNKVIDLEKES